MLDVLLVVLVLLGVLLQRGLRVLLLCCMLVALPAAGALLQLLQSLCQRGQRTGAGLLCCGLLWRLQQGQGRRVGRLAV